MPKMNGRFQYRTEIIVGYLLMIFVSYYLDLNALNANAFETANRSHGSIDTLHSNLPYKLNRSLENKTKENESSDKQNNTRLLAEFFESSIHRITSLIESTSREPAVRNISFAGLISTDMMGIPKDSDIEKRKIADSLLEVPGLGSVYFTMPNGDVYLGEPYLRQKQLPRLNFADRDWHKGVFTTNDTYISSVFTSASIHAPAIAIAVPVYGDDSNKTVIGYWVGIVNIEKVWGIISDKFVPSSEELIVFDDKRNLIFDSKRHNHSEIITRSTSFKNDSGTLSTDKSMIKKLEGNQLTVSYPIKVGSRTWLAMTIDNHP